MLLYTINGVYPDKNFNFVVTATPLGLVPAVHTHAISAVEDLQLTLDGLEESVHTHPGITILYAGEDPEFQDAITLQGEIVSNQICSFSTSDSAVIIGYTSLQTGHAGLVLNSNPYADQFVLQVSTTGNTPPSLPENGILHMNEKTLDFVTKTAEEFIKNVFLADSSESSNIVSIRSAIKVAGGIQTKEIWPTPAHRILLKTNYDFSPGRTLKESAYAGPTIDKSVGSPLVVTVEPYPSDACWKLGHSDNISDSAFFNTIYKGKRTITVPFSLINPDTDYQDTWISAYPATSAGTAAPVKFRFWCKGGSGTEGDSTGDDTGFVAPTAANGGLVAHWEFTPESLLVDSINGYSLATDKNPSSAESHIVDIGPTGYALKNTVSDGANNVIGIDGHNYGYASVLDQESAEHAKYAWYCIDTNTTYYTEVAKPEVGSVVYNADDSASAYTTTSFFVEDVNAWETTLDALNINSDTMTVAYYFNAGGAVYGSVTPKVRIGQKTDVSDISSLINIHYDTYERVKIDGAYTNGGITSGNQGISRTNGFSSIVVSLTRVIDLLDPAETYTEQRGYGVVLHEGYKIKGLGAFYVRDILNDMTIDDEQYYAFSWANTGISGADIVVPTKTIDDVATEIPTVWSKNELPNNYEACYDSTGAQISGVSFNVDSYAGSRYYKIEVIDDRYGSGVHVTFSGKIASGYYSGPTKNNTTHTRLLMYWIGGIFKGALSCGLFNNHTPYDSTIRIDLQKYKAGDSINAISDLRIYNRLLTSTEILDLNSILTGELASSSSSTSGSPVDDKILLDQTVPKKICVAGSWYVYDPFKTVFSPTAKNSRAAMFAWQKISGDGHDLIYTSEYLPKTTEFCRTTPTGSPDSSLRVTQLEDLSIAEQPMDCCQLVPFIIDSKTIAVIIWTHDAVLRQLRTRYPNSEALMRRSQSGIESYKFGEYLNVPLWVCHHDVQHEICSRADDITRWKVDNNDVTLRDRAYIAPFVYRLSKDELQWRNCKPGDVWYSEKPELRGEDYVSVEVGQIAYLTLPTAMTPGSTHTVTWEGNTCSITYSPDQYCATIKVNQEGYLPYPGIKRYAYLGRWTGTSCYTPSENDRTFYIVPAGSTSTTNAIFSGTMTQRCIAQSNAGLCSDMYGIGNYAGSKPVSRENTFEMDFTNLTTREKETIVAGGTTYFRDTVVDTAGGYIVVTDGENDQTYYRDIDNDTCNAYAWSTTSDLVSNGRQLTIYTDVKTPAVNDACRLSYDGIPDIIYTIKSVNIASLQGWTTERTTEADWATAQTIWTRSTDYTSITQNSFTGVIAKATNNWFKFQTAGASLASINVTGYTASVQTADVAGEYQVYIPNIGWSHKFLLHPQAIFKQFWTNMRGLYHQRSGCGQIHHPWTNWEYPYAFHERTYDGNFVGLFNDESQAKDTNIVWEVDPNTHEEIFDAYGAKTQLSASGKVFNQCSVLNGMNVQPLWSVYGGWCDAADFDMRDQHLQIIGELAMAYIWFPDNFYDGQLDLPESGDGIPDILNEALWGAELYRKAQHPEGGIRGWFETSGHESDWPWFSKMKYYACMRSKRMSIKYAAPAARLARALRLAASRTQDATAKAKMENLSKAYTESAIAAWEYAMRDYDGPYMLKPNSVRAPEYFESQGKTWAWRENLGTCQTERWMGSGFKTFGTNIFNAAAALYILTKESRFLSWLGTQAAINASNEWYGNENDKGLNFPYEMVLDIAADLPAAAAKWRQTFLTDANNWCNRMEAHAYRWLNWKPGGVEKNFQYIGWGTAHPDTRGTVLMAAYMLTGDSKYRSALLNAFDHICGCNPLGRTFTPGLGKVFPNRYLDHWTPRDILLNGLESARPGVTPDIFGDNKQIPDKAIKTTLGGVASNRAAASGLVLNHFPALWRQHYQVTTSNWKENLYYSQMPYYSVAQLWGHERENVQGFEYTVDSTISRKALLTGCLMGAFTHKDPRYKQIRRLKRKENLPNLVILP